MSTCACLRPPSSMSSTPASSPSKMRRACATRSSPASVAARRARGSSRRSVPRRAGRGPRRCRPRGRGACARRCRAGTPGPRGSPSTTTPSRTSTGRQLAMSGRLAGLRADGGDDRGPVAPDRGEEVVGAAWRPGRVGAGTARRWRRLRTSRDVVGRGGPVAAARRPARRARRRRRGRGAVGAADAGGAGSPRTRSATGAGARSPGRAMDGAGSGARPLRPGRPRSQRRGGTARAASG